ncbi:MAG: hypothetical protein JWL73_2239 [Actinomycetia bacterium]|nr:hypothetical protein [Actinomycetes bacterium]
MFGFRHHRMREERLAAGFLPEWRALLADRFGFYPMLSDDERGRLEGLALGLIADKHWEAANGFELRDEIMVMISAQAAMLILDLPADSYRNVHTILVHPTTYVLQGPHSQVAGLVSDEPMPILGLADFNGPVLLAWDTVLDDARHPGTGHNVVFHEFAHKIDMLDGTADGTPPLADRAQFDHWVAVCTKAYEQVVEGRGGRSLREYGGVNPGEFFAVATESFFDDSVLLRAEHPDLYGVLRDFYRQDPATRVKPGA